LRAQSAQTIRLHIALPAVENQIVSLPYQQRNLENENGSDGGGDGKKRLRQPDRGDFVCHVPSPLTELIEQSTD
jgi:hypothetical protein